jgi:hypothetical protein
VVVLEVQQQPVLPERSTLVGVEVVPEPAAAQVQANKVEEMEALE